MPNSYFAQANFAFLTQLDANNNRAWFDEHRQTDVNAVRAPALDFIGALASDIQMISPHFLAIAKKVSCSRMRIHRDLRFDRDKRPYKTNIGIQFRHFQARTCTRPASTFSLNPRNVF